MESIVKSTDIWTVIHPIKEFTFKGHRDCIYALEGGLDPGTFFSSGSDGLLVKWDLAKPDEGELFAEIPSSVYAVKKDQHQNRLLAGKNFEGLLVFDLQSQKIEKALHLTKSAIFDIAVAHNQYWIASGDGLLQALDASTFDIVFAQSYSNKSARKLALSPDQKWLAIAYSDHFIRVLDLQSGKLAFAWEAHANSVFSLQFSPDGRYLLSGSRDAHLKIWEVDNSFQLHKDIVAHTFAINAIAHHPRLDFMATASMDKTIKIWDSNEFKLLKVLDKARHASHATSVNNLYWEPSQEKLLTCSDDRTIGVWDIKC